MVWEYAGMRTTLTPGDGRSTTTSACSPACSPSVSTPWKKQYEAELYDVTCHFTPSSTYSSPSRRTVAASSETSEPACSSVIA